MMELLQQMFNGLSVGSVYALVAIGTTLIFGLTGIVNFAHGELIMLGAFVTFALVEGGLPFAVAAGAATLCLGVVGILLERGLFRFTFGTPITGFIVSIGLISIFQVIAAEIWGTDPRRILPPVGGVLELGALRISLQRILVMVVALIACALLFALLGRTGFGRQLRATAENKDIAPLMGINVSLVITGTFMIGTAFAGLVGALILTLGPINPFIGASYVFKGFAVALIGGLGNVTGALVAGLTIGVAEALLSSYASGPWTDAYVYGLMVVLLFVRPGGLFRGFEGSSIS